MKTLKNSILLLLITFSISCLSVSCSNDETDKNTAQNKKVQNYLKSFYSKTYRLGKSVEAHQSINSSSADKTIEAEDLVITEVFVGDDTRARGYVVVQKSTNDFLYFFDVDRSFYKLTSVKIEANQVITLENINQLEKYYSTNEFDYIKVTEDYVAEIAENQANKRPFWGYGPATPGACGPNSNGDGGCSYGTYHQHYIFWIKDGDPVATGDVFPCDCP